MDYSAIIKKIKKRRSIIMLITCIILSGLLIYETGLYLLFMGGALKDVANYETSFWKVVIDVLVVTVFSATAMAPVYSPIQNSFTKECDPEKYMALSAEFIKIGKLDLAYATGFSFMGDFKKAIYYAEILMADNRYAITGIFYKARCEFFLGEFDAMRKTIQQYDYVAAKIKMNEKERVATEKIKKVLELMVALSENDKEKTEAIRHEISVWNEGKANECFIYYMKGLAAYKLEDRDECLYRFMYVKENGPKTFFGRSAAEYLSKLN